jgi:hypothetical protein
VPAWHALLGPFEQLISMQNNNCTHWVNMLRKDVHFSQHQQAADPTVVIHQTRVQLQEHDNEEVVAALAR